MLHFYLVIHIDFNAASVTFLFACLVIFEKRDYAGHCLVLCMFLSVAFLFFALHVATIRYFVKVAQEALCLDWVLLLGVLLLDEAVVRQATEWAGEKLEVLMVGGIARVVQEMEDLALWASTEWYVGGSGGGAVCIHYM